MIGPLLTHSLLWTAQLSLSLCLLCRRFFKFDLLIPQTIIPLDNPTKICKLRVLNFNAFLPDIFIFLNSLLKIIYLWLCVNFFNV